MLAQPAFAASDRHGRGPLRLRPVASSAGLGAVVPVRANNRPAPVVWAGVEVPIVPITTVR